MPAVPLDAHTPTEVPNIPLDMHTAATALREPHMPLPVSSHYSDSSLYTLGSDDNSSSLHSDSSSSDAYDSFCRPTSDMSPNSAAKCVHAEPKRIPLLTPGVVSPMVMHQWEMACMDFFRVNKKILLEDCMAAILPGLKDMRAQDWVAMHGDQLAEMSFTDFVKEMQKEFLPDGWDDELHAKIQSLQLKVSNLFPTWVNDIRHLNIILHNTEYHFSESNLWLQLDSLLDADLQSCCKNRNMKEIVDKVMKGTPEQTDKARLTCWITEVQKLAEECMNDTKCYLEVAEDLQCGPKRQALVNPTQNTNTVGGYKP